MTEHDHEGRLRRNPETIEQIRQASTTTDGDVIVAGGLIVARADTLPYDNGGIIGELGEGTITPERPAVELDKVGVIRQNGYTVETLHEAGGDGLRTVSVTVTSPEGRGVTAIRSYFGSVETTGQLAAGDAFDDAMRLHAVAAGVEPWTPEVVK